MLNFQTVTREIFLMKIAIIEAGNGGQAMAGHLAMQGHKVSLYDINAEKIATLRKTGRIKLEGKKLLILGGNALSCDIVEAAKELGLYTIVTDWNDITQSPAKQCSDEYWNISLMDYDALTEKIK